MSETTNEKWTIENYIVEYDNGDATFWRLVDPKGDEQASDLCESEANLLVEKLNALTAANARVEAMEKENFDLTCQRNAAWSELEERGAFTNGVPIKCKTARYFADEHKPEDAPSA